VGSTGTVGIQLKTTTVLESNNREGLPTEHRQRSEAVIKLRPENTGGRSMPGLSFSLSLIRRTLSVYGSGSPASSLSLSLPHFMLFMQRPFCYTVLSPIPDNEEGTD
jgi:hypothetical protein